MRIAHVTHRAWPVTGGSERYVLEVARRQVTEGHDVTIVATTADDLSALWSRAGRRLSATTPDASGGVRIVRLQPRYLPLGGLTFPLLRRLTRALTRFSADWAMGLGRFAPWLPNLREALTQLDPELLFAWNLTLEALTAEVAAHGASHRRPWVAVPLLHLARPYYTMKHQLCLLRDASLVVAQTETERAILVQSGLCRSRVIVSSPGITASEAEGASPQRFRAEYGLGSRPLVVTLGALGYDKGTLHLLAAARRLWNDGIPLELALVGTLSPRLRLALSALRADHRRHCHVLGRVSEAMKWSILAAADVLALPSRTESYGIVFLEAWMLGKPVIGASAGAVESVVDDGVDGMLVQFADVGALAEAMRALIEQPAVAARMGTCGQAKVLSRYTWDVQYAHLRDAVEALFTE
jgi:glycogen synthase